MPCQVLIVALSRLVIGGGLKPSLQLRQLVGQLLRFKRDGCQLPARLIELGDELCDALFLMFRRASVSCTRGATVADCSMAIRSA